VGVRLWRRLFWVPEHSVRRRPSLHGQCRDTVPTKLPRVVWRAGLDLKPVDLSDPGEVRWLEALVWPEQTDRRARLRAAIKIASEQKPRLVKGDLRTDLARLATEMPGDATRVIYHTAVLPYISSAAHRLHQYSYGAPRLVPVPRRAALKVSAIRLWIALAGLLNL
jgi:hypothetical protein